MAAFMRHHEQECLCEVEDTFLSLSLLCRNVAIYCLFLRLVGEVA